MGQIPWDITARQSGTLGKLGYATCICCCAFPQASACTAGQHASVPTCQHALPLGRLAACLLALLLCLSLPSHSCMFRPLLSFLILPSQTLQVLVRHKQDLAAGCAVLVLVPYCWWSRSKRLSPSLALPGLPWPSLALPGPPWPLQVLKRDKEDLEARYDRAMLYADMGENKKAIEGLEQVGGQRGVREGERGWEGGGGEDGQSRG